MREPTLLERVAAVEAESRDRSEKYLKLQAAVEAAKGIALAARAETELLRAELDRERAKAAGLIDGIKHANTLLSQMIDHLDDQELTCVREVLHHLMGTITDQYGAAYMTELDEERAKSAGLAAALEAALPWVAVATAADNKRLVHPQRTENHARDLAQVQSALAAYKGA